MPNGVKVLVNPTPNEVQAWFEKYTSLRAVVEPTTADVFVWPAYDIEHQGVIRYFGLTPDWERDDGTYLRHVNQESDIKFLFDIQAQVRNRLTKKRKKQAAISGQIVKIL